MNLGQRFLGVFTNPKEIFPSLAEKPIWVDAMIIVLIATIIYGYLIAPFSAKENYELMQGSTKLRAQLGEERFNTMLEQSRQKAEQQGFSERLFQGSGAGLMAVMVILIQTLILLVLSKFFSTQGTYQQLMSAMFHANFINCLLGNFLRFILASAKQSIMKVSTGLAVFFPALEPTSSAFIILNSIDFFQLWMFGVLGYAISAIFKMELKKAFIISYVFWAFKTIFNIALGIWSLSRV
jgi:hypothetical protein